MSKLPDKLSDLLDLAIDDAQKCEVDPAYELDMWTFHSPIPEAGTCAVCLAGAVMAQTLGTEPDEHANPETFDSDTAIKLARLDEMRKGIFVIDGNFVDDELYRLVRPQYNAGIGRAPWETYREAARCLRERGL